MFDNLLQLVKENAGDAIIGNSAIPTERNTEAITTTTHSIIDGLKSQLANGNMNNILDMFNPATPQNTSVNQAVSSSVINNLVSKLGVNQSQASGIAASLIPKVMGKLVSKTNDPSDSSFDFKGIMGMLDQDGVAAGFLLRIVTSENSKATAKNNCK